MIYRVQILTACSLFILLFASCTSSDTATTRGESAQEANRIPNIVLIFVDDMGYADIEGFGPSETKTPHLAQLASEGMKLTHFYTTPNCSPSRAALLTGCYPQRVGIPWVVGPEGPEWTEGKSNVGLHPDEKTIAELLKETGYTTAAVGKWHLGHHKPHLPVHHGFDQFYGLPYSNDMWPVNNPVYAPLPLLDGEMPVDTIATLEDQSRLTGLYTRRAVQFIRENQAQPFFLYLAHSMPHVPINASEVFRGKSQQGLYGDVIQEIDGSVGQVLATLDSLDLDENTLVIFTSDNGPWLVYGDHAGSAAPFREGKHTTFEGGVRVPFIARWTGKIPAGTISEAMAGVIDLLPTLAEAGGAQMPKLAIDGKSILPLLCGESQTVPREVHYFFHTHELQAVRKGKWKLHLPHSYQSVLEQGNGGERGQEGGQSISLSLYDLENDPGESNNVAESNPAVVEELRKLAEDFAQEMEQNKREAGRSTSVTG